MDESETGESDYDAMETITKIPVNRMPPPSLTKNGKTLLQRSKRAQMVEIGEIASPPSYRSRKANASKLSSSSHDILDSKRLGKPSTRQQGFSNQIPTKANMAPLLFQQDDTPSHSHVRFSLSNHQPHEGATLGSKRSYITIDDFEDHSILETVQHIDMAQSSDNEHKSLIDDSAISATTSAAPETLASPLWDYQSLTSDHDHRQSITTSTSKESRSKEYKRVLPKRRTASLIPSQSPASSPKPKAQRYNIDMNSDQEINQAIVQLDRKEPPTGSLHPPSPRQMGMSTTSTAPAPASDPQQSMKTSTSEYTQESREASQSRSNLKRKSLLQQSTSTKGTASVHISTGAGIAGVATSKRSADGDRRRMEDFHLNVDLSMMSDISPDQTGEVHGIDAGLDVQYTSSFIINDTEYPCDRETVDDPCYLFSHMDDHHQPSQQPPASGLQHQPTPVTAGSRQRPLSQHAVTADGDIDVDKGTGSVDGDDDDDIEGPYSRSVLPTTIHFVHNPLQMMAAVIPFELHYLLKCRQLGGVSASPPTLLFILGDNHTASNAPKYLILYSTQTATSVKGIPLDTTMTSINTAYCHHPVKIYHFSQYYFTNTLIDLFKNDPDQYGIKHSDMSTVYQNIPERFQQPTRVIEDLIKQQALPRNLIQFLDK